MLNKEGNELWTLLKYKKIVNILEGKIICNFVKYVEKKNRRNIFQLVQLGLVICMLFSRDLKASET